MTTSIQNTTTTTATVETPVLNAENTNVQAGVGATNSSIESAECTDSTCAIKSTKNFLSTLSSKVAAFVNYICKAIENFFASIFGKKKCEEEAPVVDATKEAAKADIEVLETFIKASENGHALKEVELTLLLQKEFGNTALSTELYYEVYDSFVNKQKHTIEEWDNQFGEFRVKHDSCEPLVIESAKTVLERKKALLNA